MRVSKLVPLVWVVAFAIALPVIAWYGAQALAAQEARERQVAMLKREKTQQARVIQQMEQDARFVDEVESFVMLARENGLRESGLTRYPVQYRKAVRPDEIQSELGRLRGEADRFYQPHSLFLGRVGLSNGNSLDFNRVDNLSEHRRDEYVLSYQGQALVINDEI
ncbi:MAG: hypothetical protein ACQETO_08420 [Pseudomonadota bacterium]